MSSVLGGCDWFDDPTPETVRIFLSGDAGKEVELIVSQSFTAGLREDGSAVVSVLGADTLVSVLPFDSVFQLGGATGGGFQSKRFFFQASRLDEPLSTFEAKAYLDEKLRFDQGGVLIDLPYRWAYAFNQRIGIVEEVLF